MQQIRNRKQFLFTVSVMLALGASSPCTSTDLEGELDLTQSSLPHLVDETLRPEKVNMTDPSVLRGYSQWLSLWQGMTAVLKSDLPFPVDPKWRSEGRGSS